MKLLATFSLVVLFSCLGYAENEKMNPYAPPEMNAHDAQRPRTPTLLSFRDFEYEYDLEMEKDRPPRFTRYLHRVQIGHGILGLAYTAPILWMANHALRYSDFQSTIGLPIIGTTLLGSTLFWHRSVIQDWDERHGLQVERTLLYAEDRYAHLRDSVETKPIPCRATFAQLANPFRLSRVKSRLVPLAVGAGAAVTVEHWMNQDQSALSGLKSLFFQK